MQQMEKHPQTWKNDWIKHEIKVREQLKQERINYEKTGAFVTTRGSEDGRIWRLCPTGSLPFVLFSPKKKSLSYTYKLSPRGETILSERGSPRESSASSHIRRCGQNDNLPPEI